MYISTDCDKMRFAHKHPDVRVVCNLVFIECAGRHVDIYPIDSAAFLARHTETELQLLFRHTTGDGPSPYHGDQLRAVLKELALRLPESDVTPFEADMQAGHLEKRDPKGVPGYRYVKGAMVPARPDDLFTPELGTVALAADEAATVARRHAAPATHSATPATATTAPRAPRAAPSAPRSGGVRETIWKVADKMWEDDGRPTDKAAVLHLRKKVMEKLEREFSIKKTTSSNELGNWQKGRI